MPKTVRTLTLCPERAEHHHIVPRSLAKWMQFDARNILLLCCACHQRITRHELQVFAPREYVFNIENDFYLNAEGPLTFRETA